MDQAQRRSCGSTEGCERTACCPVVEEIDLVVADGLHPRGYLVAGCVDKAVFGKFGLIHAVQVCWGRTITCTRRS